MDAIALGPLLLSGERFAILAGVFVFLIGTGLLASRVSPRFNLWSTVVVLGGLAAARLAHVIGQWSYFSDDPLRALAVWQGGFNWPWVLPVVALSLTFLLRSGRERAWAIAPLAAATLAWTTAHHLASATEPLPPPAVTLAALDGTRVDLAASDGRPTVINLWATWCAPCRREMPALAQAERAHPDVRFLLINQGEGDARVGDFLKREGLSFDHILLDPAMATQRHYRTVGIPVTLFLYPDGRLAKAHTGEIAPERIAAEIARLKSP
ncbi:TlpA disulfide reductase family protein [Brevundimonas pondensis]|uniref:TlpA disulfide reductase family protein n=1 Tax=Brevundimonas pondensis TaxID=2774189 RepID=UPI00320827BE